MPDTKTPAYLLPKINPVGDLKRRPAQSCNNGSIRKPYWALQVLKGSDRAASVLFKGPFTTAGTNSLAAAPLVCRRQWRSRLPHCNFMTTCSSQSMIQNHQYQTSRNIEIYAGKVCVLNLEKHLRFMPTAIRRSPSCRGGLLSTA